VDDIMPTVETVAQWIQENVLDSSAWDNSTKQAVAVTQATRNLQRWYPDEEHTDEVVAYQAIWELQGIDPALKYQKHGVKSVADSGERIDYGDLMRDKVAPEVRDILGSPVDEYEGAALYGGRLV
jgi:hypothetical protein